MLSTPAPQGSVDVYSGRVVSVKAPLKKLAKSIREATFAAREGTAQRDYYRRLVFQLQEYRGPRMSPKKAYQEEVAPEYYPFDHETLADGPTYGRRKKAPHMDEGRLEAGERNRSYQALSRRYA